MWILRVFSNDKARVEALYTATLQKIRKQPIAPIVDVIKRDYSLYLITSDIGLGVVLLLSVYLKARGKGFHVGLYYAKQLSENNIPQDILSIADKWNRRRLSYSELRQLSQKRVTPT